MQPTPIKPWNVFAYLVTGLVIVAFVGGTIAYLIAGEDAAATVGKISLLAGPLAGGLFGLSRRFK